MPVDVDTLRDNLDDAKFPEFQALLRSLKLETLMQQPPGEVTPFIQQVMEKLMYGNHLELIHLMYGSMTHSYHVAQL